MNVLKTLDGGEYVSNRMSIKEYNKVKNSRSYTHFSSSIDKKKEISLE